MDYERHQEVWAMDGKGIWRPAIVLARHQQGAYVTLEKPNSRFVFRLFTELAPRNVMAGGKDRPANHVHSTEEKEKNQ